MSSPIMDVQPMQSRDATVSIVNATDLPQEHNAFLDTTPVHPVLYILPR
jgi:hypothetical protein